MKKFFFSAAFLAISVGPAQAAPITITDQFIGGAPTSPSWYGADVIGDADKFDISSLNFEITGSSLTVNVISSYFNNVGQYGTRLGDLFISTNGWHPYGSAPYTDDTASNGETWEYALVLSNHGESAAQSGNPANFVNQSGTISLYQITNPAQIQLSNASGIYRGNQEVLLNTSGLQALATGSWGIFDLPGEYDQLRFTIATSIFSNVTDWGFHYGMTCGNDVIEGGAAVPEPASAMLLLTAIGGAAFLRRRRAA